MALRWAILSYSLHTSAVQCSVWKMWALRTGRAPVQGTSAVQRSAVQCAGTTAWIAGPTGIQQAYPLASPAVQCNAVHRHAVQYTALHCSPSTHNTVVTTVPVQTSSISQSVISHSVQKLSFPSNLWLLWIFISNISFRSKILKSTSTSVQCSAVQCL